MKRNCNVGFMVAWCLIFRTFCNYKRTYVQVQDDKRMREPKSIHQNIDVIKLCNCRCPAKLNVSYIQSNGKTNEMQENRGVWQYEHDENVRHFNFDANFFFIFRDECDVDSTADHIVHVYNSICFCFPSPGFNASVYETIYVN